MLVWMHGFFIHMASTVVEAPLFEHHQVPFNPAAYEDGMGILFGHEFACSSKHL